jgi:hypothetical protein
MNQGRPPLPHITPHSLRRTYISIALLANNFDVKWVMSQVGHADSKMTMDVYAQLEQRAKRDHGKSFDRLIRQARNLHGQPTQAPQTSKKVLKRYRDQKTPDPAPHEQDPDAPETAPQQAKRDMARPGFEPGTPRFSVVCSTN